MSGVQNRNRNETRHLLRVRSSSGGKARSSARHQYRQVRFHDDVARRASENHLTDAALQDLRPPPGPQRRPHRRAVGVGGGMRLYRMAIWSSPRRPFDGIDEVNIAAIEDLPAEPLNCSIAASAGSDRSRR